MSQNHISRLVLPTSLLLLCACTTPNANSLNKNQSLAECERRLQRTVDASNATNTDSPRQGLNAQNQQSGNINLGNNNPCIKSSRLKIVDKNELEAREMAKTRAEVQLQDNDTTGAFQTLQYAFSQNASSDKRLFELTKKLNKAMGPKLQTQLNALTTKATKSMGMCFFSDAPFTDKTQPSVLVSSPKTIHIRCVPPRPITLEKETTKATLKIEQRLGNDKYKTIHSAELGLLKDLAATQLAPVDATWDASTLKELRSYLRIRLVLTDDEKTSISTSKAGIFFFAAPDSAAQ